MLSLLLAIDGMQIFMRTLYSYIYIYFKKILEEKNVIFLKNKTKQNLILNRKLFKASPNYRFNFCETCVEYKIATHKGKVV